MADSIDDFREGVVIVPTKQFYADRERKFRVALEQIIAESPPDTSYGWCQIKLARCHEIARKALAVE